MNTCPSCNIRLTDDELREGRCSECGGTFEPQVPSEPGPPDNMQTIDSTALPIELDTDDLEFLEDDKPATAPADRGMQTIDASQLPATEDSDDIDFETDDAAPDPTPNYQQTVDADSLAALDDSEELDFDADESPGPAPVDRGMQTLDAAQLPASEDSDAIDFDIDEAEAETTPNYQQTVDAASLAALDDSEDLDFDSDTIPEPAPDDRGMQTLDASQLPASEDSDAIDFDTDEAEAETKPNYQQTVDAASLAALDDSEDLDFDSDTSSEPAPDDRGMQTLDASQLPAAEDSDAIDFDIDEADADTTPNYQQTVDAASLAALDDSDSLDFDSDVPPADAADRGMQTIDASQLPAASDSDSVDFEEGVAPPTEDRAYTQTVDSSALPAEDDTDSFDGDVLLPSESEPPAYNQTVDASQLPADIDSDSVDFDTGVGGQDSPAIGQTIDSTNLAPSADTDSIDGMDGDGTDKGKGTVSDRREMQTVDATTLSGEAPDDGTVSERGVMATVDSTDIGEEGGTVGERQLAQTYDSSVIADDPKKMDDMWGGKQNAGATPGMTIKGREVAPSHGGSQTLSIKARSFREIEEERAFGSAAEYDLMKKLGEGGMGVVYLGRQAAIDRSVAIKMLKPNMAADANQRNKFLSEAVITGDLDHPNIVPIYDLGANNEGALFYAMKCVKGTPWDECIQDKTLSENIEIFLKTCDAVAFGHSRGIIHRDLKPENTMIGGFGEVLVMDWGLALPYGDRFEKSRSIMTSASMGGTPAYMAPEMATGPFDKMGPASDVYLLGAILYEIVTGHPPHRGKDVMKCLFAAAKNQIVPTEKTGELVDIALTAMATNAEDRYATVQDLAAAIRSYQDHSESIVMSVRAADELEKAQAEDSYDDFSRAVFGFEEALALWDGNERAAEGVTQAKLAYATSALHKGDYDLGSSLLDPDKPEHADIAVQIDEARREREIRHQRAHTLKRVVTIMTVTGVILAIAVSIVMYSLKRVADDQRLIAQKAEKVAKREKKEADIARADAEQKKQEADVARANEKEQRLIAVQKQEEAEKARADEEKQRLIAVQKQEEAEDAREKEEEQRLIAVAAQREEEKQKNLAKYEAYIALIGLAAAKIDENAFTTANSLLDQCDEDLRNWEWGRLKHICNQSVRDYNAGVPIDAIAFAPDGERFVTGGWQGTARVWNRTEGTFVELPQGGLYVQAVAFSPTEDRVATASSDKNIAVQIWDAATGQPVLALKRYPKSEKAQGHTDAVTSLNYSKDGKQLLSTSFDNTARLWDVAAGKQLQVLEGHSWWVWDAAFSPDEQSVATVSQDGTALVWSLEDGSKGAPFTGHQGPVYSVAFDPGGEFVATGGYDKRVLLWRPEDVEPYDFNKKLADEEIPQTPYRALEEHKAAVRSVAFSQDGRLLLSAGHDNTVQVWHAGERSLIKTLRGHGSWVRSCAFSPDGKWVLSGGYDNHARLWNIDGYQEVKVLRGRVLAGHQDAIMAVSFSRDGQQIATASRDRTAKSWDARTGSEVVSFREGHQFLASDSAFFADNKRLITSAVDNTVRMWDLSTGVELKRLDRTGRAAAISVSHDDRWIVTGSDNRTAKLWNVETGEMIVLNGHKVEVTAAAFSPDDRFIYTGDANGRGVLWDREAVLRQAVAPQDGTPRATDKYAKRLNWHTSKVAAAVFLPDGSRLVTASDDKTVCQWNTRRLTEDPGSVEPLVELRCPHPDSVVSLDLSADGTRALTACLDGRIRMWNVADAKLLRELHSPSSPATSAALSRDGRLAISVHADDRVVRLWNLETGQPLPGAGQDKPDVFLDFNKLGGLVWSARLTNDASAVLTVGGAEARLWDIRQETPDATRREIMTFSPHAAVASANFSPDGLRIVTASWDNSARIWNAKTGRSLLKLERGHSGYVNSAIFAPPQLGDFVLTASDDRTAKLWNAKSGQVVKTYAGHRGRVRYATFSPDGRFVLTASEDKTARIWDSRTEQLLKELKDGHKWGVLSVAFSADGKSVITGSDDNSARVWDLQNNTSIELAGHTAAVTSVAFSPDGKRALTASEDFTAKLWDAETGKEILNLRGHSQEVTSVTFSDDGRYALTGSRDGTAILWLTEEWMQPVPGE